jgi:hypothetical protein
MELANENDVSGAQGLQAIVGDWAAVKVLQINGPNTRKGKEAAKVAAFLHLARIESIEVDSDSYTVSFLKKNNDGSYSWPDRDDISSVQQHEIFLV